MRNKDSIVRGTAEQIAKMLAKDGDQSDWARVRTMSQEDADRAAAEEDGDLPAGWEQTVTLGIPEPKQAVHIRLDTEVVRWFKAHGPGYQTRINAALRAFVAAKQQSEG